MIEYPKLDDVREYVDKFVQIFKFAGIKNHHSCYGNSLNLLFLVYFSLLQRSKKLQRIKFSLHWSPVSAFVYLL
ncbi:MAG: hypothetical protein DRG59_04080 [Deltaproteobacteria bacterium]|nr:MAG: hypothetical protein DRG59_04080 [Deltaproteobacteria bacterium]